MECAEVVARLWEYLDHALETKESAAIKVHLGGCPECRTAHACDRGLLDLLWRARLAGPPVPPRLAVAVRNRLRDRA